MDFMMYIYYQKILPQDVLTPYIRTTLSFAQEARGVHILQAWYKQVRFTVLLVIRFYLAVIQVQPFLTNGSTMGLLLTALPVVLIMPNKAAAIL